MTRPNNLAAAMKALEQIRDYFTGQDEYCGSCGKWPCKAGAFLDQIVAALAAQEGPDSVDRITNGLFGGEVTNITEREIALVQRVKAEVDQLRCERDDLRGKLESLQGEVVGAITDAGGAMLENNPCAPGETASAIARLARWWREEEARKFYYRTQAEQAEKQRDEAVRLLRTLADRCALPSGECGNKDCADAKDFLATLKGSGTGNHNGNEESK